jgi:hypothetical protein
MNCNCAGARGPPMAVVPFECDCTLIDHSWFILV